MAIEQKNVYSTTQNIANLANNVDYNRLGLDKSSIDATFASGEVVIQTGTLVEVLGNLYAVTEDITLSGATGQQYIHFSGSAFTLSTDRGVYDPEKVGYYDTATGLNRVLKYFIDSDTEDVYTLFTYKDSSDNLFIEGTAYAETLYVENLTGVNNMFATGDIEIFSHTYAGGTDYSSEFTILRPVILYIKNTTDGHLSYWNTGNYLFMPGIYKLQITTADNRFYREIDSSFPSDAEYGSTQDVSVTASNTTGDVITIRCTYAQGISTLDVDDIIST